MKLELLKSKLHRIKVTDTLIDYEGSVAIDMNILEEANILPYEKVDIYNVNNGERLTTYAIEGKRGSGEVCINGAAARKAMKGDVVIIVAFASFKTEEAKNFKPTVLLFDGKNNLKREKK